MSSRPSRSSFACLFALLVPVLPAQEQGAPAAARPAPLRVHIIGASVSGGFEDGPLTGAEERGDSVPLLTLLRRWADGGAKVTSHSPQEMIGLFLDPIGTGGRELAGVKRAAPDIVVAIDFPFWFAYGYVGADELRERGALLHKGLAMLAELKMPVLIGNLPDMRGAAQRMLSPRQIPSPAVLAALNAELAKFVAEHDNFRLVDLASVVRRMREEGVALPLADGPVKTPKLALQQQDRLHATRLGMAYLGFMLQPTLRAAFPEDHPLHARAWTFEQFVEAAGAEDELDELRETVGVKAGEGKAGGGESGR